PVISFVFFFFFKLPGCFVGGPGGWFGGGGGCVMTWIPRSGSRRTGEGRMRMSTAMPGRLPGRPW
ncbi:hypothetical protein PV366_41400, partial [Streptomyces ipomoeae]|nr:hypothetical protein [Streptomyces ipomoeae]